MRRTVDLRSDTVTLPTPEMRQAMAAAEVGDDVYGEDPTINKLQQLCASLLGKEAALFVPSGTMGNQLAIMTHCLRGEEVLVDAEAHVLHYELNAAAVLSGVQLKPVPGLHREKEPVVIEEFIRPHSYLYPRTSLLCLENTLNRGGGTVVSPAFMEEICRQAKSRGLKVHLDGARLFNAALYLQCTPAALAAEADSVMVSLSKGLGAPVGSLLSGTREFILKAHKYRKLLGGGMRQAGVLAAAGIVALSRWQELKSDHDNARFFAEKLALIPGIKVNLESVQTNMVIADISGTGRTTSEFVSLLESRGVKAGEFGGSLIRFVTHKDVDREDVEFALEAINSLLKQEKQSLV
ncbi:MAG TPA: low specificity L-threonine aldolase [Firmicutes bacterium]|nr:low specificity L-threonine aldolase [Bacillota bacterium]